MNSPNTILEAEMANLSSYRRNTSQKNLLEQLESANRTIRTLEHRVAMQERTYMDAMREKNQKIRELRSTLQGKQ